MKESEASHAAGAPTQPSQNPAGVPSDSNSPAFTTTLTDEALGAPPLLLTLRYPMLIRLDHIGKEGQSAIDAREVERIKSIILREVELALPGGFHQRMVITADNVLECTRRSGRSKCSIPEGATFVRAVFDIVFAGSTTPTRVEIRPPNVVLVAESADIPALTHWLTVVCCRAANLVTRTAVIALLTVSTAFSPILDDDDADDDDTDWHLAHAALRA